MKTFILILLAASCYGQRWVLNTDIKRGNVNQYIQVDNKGNPFVFTSIAPPYYDSTVALIKTVTIDTLIPKKKPFIPTPASAAKAGFIMTDSVINGKTVKIIREDMSAPDVERFRKDASGSFPPSSGYGNVAFGQAAMAGISGGGFASDYDTPKPGEKLQICRYCDMMRTLAHRIYVAKMMGSGYVQISKGVWAYTN